MLDACNGYVERKEAVVGNGVLRLIIKPFVCIAILLWAIVVWVFWKLVGEPD